MIKKAVYFLAMMAFVFCLAAFSNGIVGLAAEENGGQVTTNFNIEFYEETVETESTTNTTSRELPNTTTSKPGSLPKTNDSYGSSMFILLGASLLFLVGVIATRRLKAREKT